MSEFRVTLTEQDEEGNFKYKTPQKTEQPTKKKRGGCLKYGAISLLVLLIVGAIGGYFYWQSVKKSPTYSLALLVEAVRQDDQKQIDALIDIDSVVDSFLPQVTSKAVEMYGKGIPPEAIAKLTTTTDQFKPAIKRRAREEVPRVVREKIERFNSVPYWAIALGADWFLDVKINGDTATIISKIPERPFELTMKKNGELWRVTAIKDDTLAKRIAEKIGQELISISSKEGLKKASEKLGINNVEDLQKRVDDIFK
jgi:hypothetical protein